MKTIIRKVENAQGVQVPEPFLAQAGIEPGEVEIEVEHGTIVIRKPDQAPRAGWSEASKKVAASGSDALVWPAFANDSDRDLTW